MRRPKAFISFRWRGLGMVGVTSASGASGTTKGAEPPARLPALPAGHHLQDAPAARGAECPPGEGEPSPPMQAGSRRAGGRPRAGPTVASAERPARGRVALQVAKRQVNVQAMQATPSGWSSSSSSPSARGPRTPRGLRLRRLWGQGVAQGRGDQPALHGSESLRAMSGRPTQTCGVRVLRHLHHRLARTVPAETA